MHTVLQKYILLLLLAGGYITGACQQGYYRNPVLAGFYPDPSICRVDSNYYMVNSSFAYYPGLPLFHSKDLVHWTQLGHAMNRPEQLNTIGAGVSRGLFAPAISYHKGLFYIVCTLIDKGGNFVITAKDPAGPWSNPAWLPKVNGIDPSLFFDENDSTYIVYNSNPPDNQPQWPGHRTIRMQAFDYSQLQTTGEEILLVNGGTDIARKPVWIEGPHLYHVKGWYYLMCAEGGTGDQHSEVIFRSRSVTGPYIAYEGNPILTQRQLPANRPHPVTTTGHADLVETPEGHWYAVFLGCRPYDGPHYNIGRETFMAPVTWTATGWPVITQGNETVQYRYTLPDPVVPGNNGNPFNGNFTYRNDFNDSFPDHRFIFLRTVTDKWYSTSRKKGYLSLQLRAATVGGTDNPSFAGFRQQHHQYTATTALRFTAQTAAEKAGLIIFQNEHHYYFICKSIAAGKPVVQVYRSDTTATMQLMASQALPAADQLLYLRITQQGTDYRLSYSNDNSQWHVLKTADARFLSTATAGGFVGSVLGLYATSLGQPSAQYACFDWFEYKGDDAIFK